MFRQGDVLLIPVPAVPDTATKFAPGGDVILALGEVTGHAHRIRTEGVSMWHAGEQRYITVPDSGASLTHEEHGKIDLAPGNYQVRIQRVYTPEAIRNVAD